MVVAEFTKWGIGSFISTRTVKGPPNTNSVREDPMGAAWFSAPASSNDRLFPLPAGVSSKHALERVRIFTLPGSNEATPSLCGEHPSLSGRCQWRPSGAGALPSPSIEEGSLHWGQRRPGGVPGLLHQPGSDDVAPSSKTLPETCQINQMKQEV